MAKPRPGIQAIHLIYPGHDLVGKRVQEARKRRGWGTLDLAWEIGSTSRAINLIENGERGMSARFLAKIAYALGMTMDELYWGADDDRRNHSVLHDDRS